MNRARRIAAGPFAHALAGGLVVALAFWVAIATGAIRSEEDGAVAPAPATPAQVERSAASRSWIAGVYEGARAGVAGVEVTREGGGPLDAQGEIAGGSGFVLDRDGHVVTNAHVVEGASEIRVRLGGRDEPFDAELVGADPSTDIAVLRVDAPAGALHPLPTGDSGAVRVGDEVVAIGDPFGLERTVTAGIVSATGREIAAPNGFAIRDAIQTDAPINPGNSGGPLLDSAGRVIGVNSQIRSAGGGNDGVGFAVAVDAAAEVAAELIADGRVSHAYLGITGADLDGRIADSLGLGVDRGAIVQSVEPGSPADDAGLRGGEVEARAPGERLVLGGDVIVAADGEEVASMDDVAAAVDAAEPGEELELELVRGGERRSVTVELGERPPAAP